MEVQVLSSAPVLMKFLLLPAVALFFLASIWVVAYIGPNANLSISLHVAKTKLTQWVFGTVTTIATLLATCTIFGWILPYYDANLLVACLYLLIVSAFLLIAVIPHIEGTWRENAHNVAAWGVVYVIPLAMVTSQSWELSIPARAVSAILAVVAAVLLVLALFRRERYRHVFLYFQSAYLAVFFLFLLTITYL